MNLITKSPCATETKKRKTAVSTNRKGFLISYASLDNKRIYLVATTQANYFHFQREKQIHAKHIQMVNNKQKKKKN